MTAIDLQDRRDRRDAERYRFLCANPNWRFIELLCRQFVGEDAKQFKAGLDKAIDEMLREDGDAWLRLCRFYLDMKESQP